MSKAIAEPVGHIPTHSEAQRQIKQAVLGGLNKIEEAGRRAQKMEAFRSVYEKTDRIISNKDVRVNMIAVGNGIPAWTDGMTVTLNMDEAWSDDMAEMVRTTKALNLHEMCHVLYTPRQTSRFMIWIRDAMMDPSIPYRARRHIRLAWNLLEDQRIETMFTAKYRPAGGYFELAVLRFIMDGQSMDTAMIGVHGRKFLPQRLQDLASSAYVARWGEDEARRVQEIIDSYIRLVFPSQASKAKELVTDLALIMADHQEAAAEEAAPRMENGNDGNMDQGQQPEEKVQNQAQQQLDDVQPRETGEEDDGAGEGIEEDGDGAGGVEGDEEGDGGEGEEGPGDGGGEVEGDAPEPEGQGAGEGPADEPAEGREGQPGDVKQGGAPAQGAGNEAAELREAAKDLIDDLLQDEKFKADVQRVAKNIHDVLAEAEMFAEGDDTKHGLVRVPEDVKKAARAMQHQLRAMRVQLEEEHKRNQTHGQIDARRFLTRKPWEIDFFRSYDPGSLDEVDVEAVILIDQSGSMDRRMASVSQSLWATKRALEMVDARVTVMGFADRAFNLYQPDDKLSKTEMKLFGVHGGTNPDGALREAYKVLKASDRKVKILITMTDGAWFGDKDRMHTVVDAINDLGVTSQLQFMGYPRADGVVDAHHHQLATTIKNAMDLPKAAVEIVKHAMQDFVHLD